MRALILFCMLIHGHNIFFALRKVRQIIGTSIFRHWCSLYLINPGRSIMKLFMSTYCYTAKLRRNFRLRHSGIERVSEEIRMCLKLADMVIFSLLDIIWLSLKNDPKGRKEMLESTVLSVDWNLQFVRWRKRLTRRRVNSNKECFYRQYEELSFLPRLNHIATLVKGTRDNLHQS